MARVQGDFAPSSLRISSHHDSHCVAAGGGSPNRWRRSGRRRLRRGEAEWSASGQPGVDRRRGHRGPHGSDWRCLPMHSTSPGLLVAWTLPPAVLPARLVAGTVGGTDPVTSRGGVWPLARPSRISTATCTGAVTGLPFVSERTACPIRVHLTASQPTAYIGATPPDPLLVGIEFAPPTAPAPLFGSPSLPSFPWWAVRDSNPRPLARHASALPTAPTAPEEQVITRGDEVT